MRWCAVSDQEQKKCAELAKALVAVLPPAVVAAYARLSCVRAHSTTDCISKIRVRHLSDNINALTMLSQGRGTLTNPHSQHIQPILTVQVYHTKAHC